MSPVVKFRVSLSKIYLCAPFRRAGGSDSISGKGFPPFFAAINRAIKIIYFVPSCFTV